MPDSVTHTAAVEVASCDSIPASARGRSQRPHAQCVSCKSTHTGSDLRIVGDKGGLGAVQVGARSSVQAVLAALQSCITAAAAAGGGGGDGKRAAAHLKDLDKKISGKTSLVAKAAAQGEDVNPVLVAASAEAVTLLKEKYDTQRGLVGAVRFLCFVSVCCDAPQRKV